MSRDIQVSDSRPMQLRSRSCWRRRVLIGLCAGSVATMAGLICTYLFLTRPPRLMRQTLAALRDAAGLDARLGGASFRWPGTVVLENLELLRLPDAEDESRRHPPLVDGSDPWFRLDHVELELDSSALLDRRIEVDRVRITGPRLRLDESSLRTIRACVEKLRENSPRNKTTLRWPRIEVQDAALLLPAAVDPRDHAPPTAIRLILKGAYSDDTLTTYRLGWTCIDDGDASGEIRVDAHNGNVQAVCGTTPWLAADRLAAVIDAWFPPADDGESAADRLKYYGITGNLRLRDAAWNPAAPGPSRLDAVVDGELVTLSVPVTQAERSLPADARYLQFESISGSARFSRGQVDGSLDARLRGAACTLDFEGQITGFSEVAFREASFGLNVLVEGLCIPRTDVDAPVEEIRLVRDVRELTRFYDRYSPRGCVDAQMLLTKGAGSGRPVECPFARMKILNGSMVYSRFPYQGEGLTGEVEYSPLGLFVRELRGRHGDTEIVVNAYVKDLVGPSLTRVSIEGRNVALDADLQAALPASFRRVWDAFSPAGRAEVHVFIERPGEGHDRPNDWTNLIVADLRGASATYEVFPYALNDLTGRLTILDDRFHVDGLNGRHGDAAIGIDGWARYRDRALKALDLHIEARGVNVGDNLVPVLPQHMREIVDLMTPEGSFDASAALTFPAPGASQVRYDVDIHPRTLRVTPIRFPLCIENLTGRMSISNDRIELVRVTGTHGRARVSVDGTYRTEAEASFMDMTLRGDGLELDEALRRVLPEGVRRTIESWELGGPFGFTTRLVTSPADAATGVVSRHRLRLAGNTIRYRTWPSGIDSVVGELRIDNEALRSFQLTGRLEGATVEVKASQEGLLPGVFSGSAAITGLRLTPEVLAWLPERTRVALESVDASGELNLRLDEWRAQPGQEGIAWRLRGAVFLKDVAAPGAAEWSEARGTATFSGEWNPSLGFMSLEGGALIDESRVLGRRVTEVSCRWALASSPQQWSRLTLSDIRGNAYEGLVTGEVEILSRNRTTDYHVGVQIAGLQLREYLSDRPPMRSGMSDFGETAGLVDGQVSVSGRVGGIQSRTGEGRLTVREGQLYRMPPVGAVLRVINLAATEGSAVQEARATFSLTGNEIEFHDLYLRDPGVALVGYGTSRFPDQNLDLYLVAISPHRWARIPLLSEIVEGASRELMEIRVTGTMLKPVVRSETFRGIRSAIDTLLDEARPIPPRKP